jgi:hypothetical protein
MEAQEAIALPGFNDAANEGAVEVKEARPDDWPGNDEVIRLQQGAAVECIAPEPPRTKSSLNRPVESRYLSVR